MEAGPRVGQPQVWTKLILEVLHAAFLLSTLELLFQLQYHFESQDQLIGSAGFVM